MSLPPRQPRPLSAVGVPRHENNQPADPQTSLEERVQHALDMSRAGIPRIPDPGAFAYVPFVGPAWEAAVDIQNGDYAGAAFNAAMFATELTPAGPLRRVGKLVKAIKDMKKEGTPFLASANTQLKRIRTIERKARKLAGDTEAFQIHHSIPIAGVAPTSKEGRRIAGLWRNHPANLKILPPHLHNGVHHGFGNRATDPILKLWHGTNDLHKTAAAASGAIAADSIQNATQEKRTPHR